MAGEKFVKYKDGKFSTDPSGGGSHVILYGTTAEWNAQPTLVSEANIMYVYTDYRVEDGQNIPNIKIGDGLAYLIDLPFMNMDVTAAEKTFWNDKVRCYLDDVNIENLIFTTN